MKKILKNTKGMSTIEFVIALFIFIILFSFLFDLIFITYKQYAVTKETNNMIRILSRQSGVLNKVPLGFPGGKDNYITANEMTDMIKNKFNGLGITDYTVKITVEDKRIPEGERVASLPSTTGITGDYRNYIRIDINYNYKWGLWSQFVPGEITGSTISSRTGFSEFKFDYDSWEEIN